MNIFPARRVGTYRIQVDAPDYLIGYGPENEFIVIARLYARERAEQIVRLLNKDENENCIK